VDLGVVQADRLHRNDDVAGPRLRCGHVAGWPIAPQPDRCIMAQLK
jgi:hypothetical protein